MQPSAMMCLLLLVLTLFFGVTAAQEKPAPEKTKWATMIPTINDVLTREGVKCPGQQLRVGIKDAAYLAGNSVALVDFCPGGAYTDWLVAMRLENGQPVLARFRNENGEPADVGFAEGASVMHGMDAKLVPGKKAIYGIQWDNDENLRLTRCLLTAHVWNAKEKTFDLNPILSEQAQSSYCETLQKKLLKQR